MRRFVTVFLFTLFCPLVAAAQDDRGFLQGLIEDNLSSAGRDVRIVGFAGALSSRATVEEITIADSEGVWLTLRGAVLDWNRSALLRGRLEVETLSADELIIPRMPVTEGAVPSAEASAFSLPDLPVSIEIGKLAIGRADLGAALFGEAASISLDGTVSLIDGAGTAQLSVARVDGKRGTLTLDAAYANASQDLRVDLKLSEEPGGIAVNLLNIPGQPSVDLAVDGTGSLSDFRADIRLDTDGETRLAGAITLAAETRGEGPPLRRFSVDIGGDLAPVFTPEYRPFFGDNIQLQASGVQRPDGSMNLEQLLLNADSLTLEGQISLAADGLPQTLSLSGQIADPGGDAVLLPFGASPIKVARVDLDVSFDAAQDETWRGKVDLIGLDTAGLDAKNLTLSGNGKIITDTATGNRVTALLDFQGQGLDLGSPEMNEALGSEIAGKAGIDWQQGSPVKISGLQVTGAGVELTGSGTLDIEGTDLSVDGTLTADIAELSPFSGIAGRDLDGSVSAKITGSGALLGGKFDIDLTAEGQDLKVSVPQVDPLLRGQSSIALSAQRDETGLTIRRLALESPEVTGTLSGKVQSEGGSLKAEARLREISLVFPQLSGPVSFEATADQTDGIWKIKADASGPGATVSVDGSLADATTAPVFEGTVIADIRELGSFSELAGRDLGGDVSGRMTGRAALSGETFELELSLNARNLMIDIPQADALLAGEATVDLAAVRDATGIRVSRLDVQSPQVSGTASGVWQPGQSAVKVDARLTEVGLLLPQLAGPVTLVADAQEAEGVWTVTADATGPGNAVASINGTVFDYKTDPVFQGAIEADVGDLAVYSEIAKRDLSGAVNAKATGTAALSGTTFDIELAATSRDLAVGIEQVDPLLAGRATVDLAASRDAEGIRVSRLSLQSPQVTGTASGSLVAGERAITVDARIADASLITPEMSGPVTIKGTATETDGILTVKADAIGPGDAVISVDGKVLNLATDPVFEGEASADIGNLGVYSTLAKRDLGGSVTARLTGRAALSGKTFDIDLSSISRDLKTGVPQADALLAGEATIDVKAARDGADITIERLVVTSPELTAMASGSIKDGDGRLTLEASIRETARIYPQMSGPLRVTATAAGRDNVFQVEATASGPGNSDVTLAGVLRDPLTAPAFDGKVSLSADSLRPFSAVAGRSLSGSVDLRGDAKFDSANTSYDLVLTGTSQGLGIDQPQADQLLAGSARYDISVAGTGTEVLIRRLTVVTPQLQAEVKGDTRNGAIDLDYDIRLANVGLFAPGIDGPLQVAGLARQSGGRWTIDLNANGPAGSRASVDGSIAEDFGTANLGISGQAPLALANQFITPNAVSGLANFNLRLDGALDLSSLSGTVAVVQGRAVFPGPGIVLNDIGANIVLTSGRANLSAVISPEDGGRINIDGPITLAAPFDANLVLRLANVVFTDPDLYETTINGLLTATGPLAGGATLAGTLNLGRTEVQIPSTGFGKSGSIPDITHLNEPAPVRATRARAGLFGPSKKNRSSGGPRYPIDVLIVAENQIFIRGRGLDAELGGSLRLTGTTADLIPAGQFELVRGRLDILGKRLILDEGIARLQGDFLPYIRLVASTSQGEVRILISVEGEASEPKITFSSEPELPEDEVLAQLLFGRSIDQITPLQAIQLASAVATLAGRGGGGIINTLRENFGLDDLDVTTDDDGNAALRVGKYIGENLYTDVTVGSESSEINLNLDISPSVTAKGTVSSTGETSLGIFFQRDY